MTYKKLILDIERVKNEMYKEKSMVYRSILAIKIEKGIKAEE